MQMTISITKSELHEAIAQYYGIPVEKISSINVIEETSSKKPSKPLWYPDDSGEWIETNGKDPELPPYTKVHALSCKERKGFKFDGQMQYACDVCWENVVAYRLVETTID